MHLKATGEAGIDPLRYHVTNPPKDWLTVAGSRNKPAVFPRDACWFLGV